MRREKDLIKREGGGKSEEVGERVRSYYASWLTMQPREPKSDDRSEINVCEKHEKRLRIDRDRR